MIEIDVAMRRRAAAAGMFHRAVVAEMAAAAVVWWGERGERGGDERCGGHGDWMREWEAMVRWCGGGRWRRLLLIE